MRIQSIVLESSSVHAVGLIIQLVVKGCVCCCSSRPWVQEKPVMVSLRGEITKEVQQGLLPSTWLSRSVAERPAGGSEQTLGARGPHSNPFGLFLFV